MTHPIQVQPILPAVPMVLCNADFLGTLAAVESDLSHLQVRDEQTAQAAADILKRLTNAGKKLEEARVTLKAPLLAKGREIDEVAKGPARRIEKAKDDAKAKVQAYMDAAAKAAAAAEKARQAELARLEELRRKEEEERLRKVEELAEAARKAQADKPPPAFDFDDGEPPPPPPKTEIEKEIERVKFTPAKVAAAPAGVTVKAELLIESIQLEELPHTFVIMTADERKIRATFCVGWKDGDPIPECPGVRFRVHKHVMSTGKAHF